MLQISAAQLEEASRVVDGVFEKRLVNSLADFFNAHGGEANRARLEVFVKRARIKAREYGLETERDIAVFVGLSLLLGEAFHSAQWPYDVLTESSKEPSARMQILTDTYAALGLAAAIEPQQTPNGIG